MKFKDIKNESSLEFTDISSESHRVYLFMSKDGSVTCIRIDEPIGLNVSKSGGHRLINSNGVYSYIKPEWFMINWKAKDNEPHFVK